MLSLLRTRTLIALSASAQYATALYSYDATSDEEHSFDEGSTVTVVDTSDASWWKAEKDGRIGLVPATYLELSQ